MKKLNPINQVSGALKRFVLGLAVGAAVVFGVGQSANAATLFWDFKSSGDPVVGVGGEDPWVPVFPSSNPADVWQSFDGWGWIPDDGHIGAGWDTDDTRLIHSPEFYLDGSGDMTFQMIGEPSHLAAPGLAPSAVPMVAIETAGFMGVALRDIVADTYVLWQAHPGTDFVPANPAWTNGMFTAAQLAPYVIPGRKYTLDWVDFDKTNGPGSGCWAILNDVSIPGTLVSPNTNILSFYGNATISGTNITKLLVVGTDVTALSPTFTLSRGATCVPASGSTNNFTSPVNYIVTASDGGTKNYLVTVQLAPLSGKVNVNFTGTAREGLGGPRGDSGENWNQLNVSLNTLAGGTNGALWDSQGFTTTIGVSYTTDSPGLDEWGNPTLQLIRDGLRNFPTGSATGETISITNLPAGRKYDVYIASANASGGESSDGVFSTTNTTTPVSLPCVNTGVVNGTTWASGNNYVLFTNVVPDVTGTITILGTNNIGFRLPVNGIQVVDVGSSLPTPPIPTLTGITGPVVGVLTIVGSTDIAGNVVTLTTPSLSAPVTWTPLQTNAVPGGAFSFPVPQGAYPNEFYRLMGQ